MRPRGASAVMAVRRSPPKALDYFPTPPWATRVVAELVRGLDLRAMDRRILISEPACGAGHMAHVLAEEFGDTSVAASDVFNYGWGHDLADFLDPAWDQPYRDWIITNPPFSVAADFARLAIQRARRGVALLVRSVWSEGVGRYATLFGPHPPAIEAQFCERVPMVAGRWDPAARSATAYSWFIWTTGAEDSRGLQKFHGKTERRWIPPGTRDRLWMPDDVCRFAPQAPAPLFDEQPV